MRTAIVEVSNGIAATVRSPRNVRVEIVDLDLLREGDIEDIKRYWLTELSALGRNYVKTTRREMFHRISEQCNQ